MLNRHILLRPFFLAVVVLFTTAGAARAQCDNPKTDAQRAQCLGNELRGADGTINRVYGELMKSLSPADRLTLRTEQRAWLKIRDKQCGITWSKGDREAWLADLLRDYQKTVCVVRLTNERVEALNHYQHTNAVAPPAPPTGADADPVYDMASREPKTKGKWYFEVKVDAAAIQKMAETALFVGVMQAAPEAGAANANGQSTGRLMTIRRIDKDLAPATLGFAMDLDNGKLYMSENGEWQDGAPGSAGGQDLLRGRTYSAMLTSSVAMNPFLSSHALDVNFGERDFVYHTPDGYQALQPH